MYLVWAGLALLILKFFEIGPVGQWSWWWILAPLAVAFAWFEGLEKAFGRDKRKADHVEWEKSRKERVAAQFGPPAEAKAPKRT